MRWMKDTKEANWLDDTFGETFMLKFQLAHVHQTTYPHRDNNGTDTHIKLLCGMVLAATWSQADGDADGLTDAARSSRTHAIWSTGSGSPRCPVAASSCSARAMCS